MRRPTPRYPAGGIRKILDGHVSHGPSFSIVGEREPHHHRLSIQVQVQSVTFAPLGAQMPEGESLSVPEGRSHHRRPLAFQVYSSCLPHEFAIVYGVLSQARDRVLARIGGRLVALRRSAIPTSLHVPGTLVSRAVPAVPSALLVRTPRDRTLRVVHLAKRAKRAREVCEGEAEPAS